MHHSLSILRQNIHYIQTKQADLFERWLEEEGIHPEALEQVPIDQLAILGRRMGIHTSLWSDYLLSDLIKWRAYKPALILSDVDGCLTDGSLYYGPEGQVLKRFHVRDGMVIHRLITRQNMVFGWISGGGAEEIVKVRARDLGVRFIYVGKRPKIEIISQWLEEIGSNFEEVLYLGDDVNDLPAIDLCGLTACPADAVQSVKEKVNIVLRTPGGHGCVRELLEGILGYNIDQ